jgi:AraC-like DNA-binding protein/ligand-binding sensor protein
MVSPNEVVDFLARSKVFQDYARSFTEMTGLPLVLRPVESWQLPYQGRQNRSRFCALLVQKSSACASCLRTQQSLSESAAAEPQTVTCATGLLEMAVPLRLNGRLVGFLQTGQALRRRPTGAQFERVARQAAEWGIEAGREELREAYYETRVLGPTEQEAILALLGVFAQHLTMVSNQVVVYREHTEPPVIAKAKAFIEAHKGEELTLPQVAKAVNASTYYFCKIFRKFTGTTLMDYISRVRIEKAKNLALNPNLKISEIAFDVGFQSLTHFNRVFRKLTGHSPTGYREQLAVS